MKSLTKRKILGFLNDLQAHKKIRYIDSTNGSKRLDSIRRSIPNLLNRCLERQKTQTFYHIVGYDGIKQTFLRSLSSEEPVHILLVGPPGQAKTLFLKCILETFGEKKAFFTVGGNASKSGLIDVLFDMQPKYLLVDEIEHLKPEYQTTLLSLMETGILSQTMHSKVRHVYLKTWIFATSSGTKKISDPLLSRFRVMYLNKYEFSQFYEIAVKKLLAEGLDKKTAGEITISVWEQLPNPNIRNCVQIGRLVKNEPDIETAIADEIHNFKEYGMPEWARSTDF